MYEKLFLNVFDKAYQLAFANFAVGILFFLSIGGQILLNCCSSLVEVLKKIYYT